MTPRAISPRVLLINPPVYDFALYDLFHKPAGLLRLGGFLSAAGFDVRYINAMDYTDAATAAVLGAPRRRADGTGKFFRQVVEYSVFENSDRTGTYAYREHSKSGRRRFARYGILSEVFKSRMGVFHGDSRGPDIILITSGMTYWYLGVLEAAGFCREVFPGVPVVLGGIYATLLPEHAKTEIAPDYIISGQAYDKLPFLLQSLGLWTDQAAETIGQPAVSGSILNRPLPLINSAYWGEAGVVTLNRGCPYSCNYCASRALAGEFESGNPDSVFREITAFAAAGIRNIGFYDDALLVRKENAFVPLFEMITSAKSSGNLPEELGFHLPNAVHIRYIDGKIAELMMRTCFRDIRLGFESSSGEFHENLGDKFDPKQFEDAIKALVSRGFARPVLGVNVLAGLPGQFAEEVEDSVAYLKQFPVRIHIAEYSPVPGSALWEKSVSLSRYPLEEEPMFHNNTIFPMEWEGFTREDLRKIKEWCREK